MHMTDSSASFVAILLGLGIFLVIVAIGWRSVQNRRIVRLQNANGQETIIVASEDDEISSVTTTAPATQPASEPAPSAEIDSMIAPQFGRSAAKGSTEI